MSSNQNLIEKGKNGLRSVFVSFKLETLRNKGKMGLLGIVIVAFLVLMIFLTVIWGREPDMFDVNSLTIEKSEGTPPVIGYTTTATLIKVAETLLDKPGGYLSNDVTPPSVFMDNIPNWEFGVLVQVRDLAKSLRNDMSRSQSQSVEDKDLAIAEPQFNFSNNSWLFPPTEGEYRTGIEALKGFLRRLQQSNERDAQFYARADNLRDWLAVVGKRLGSLSQRLSASVGQVRLNTDLAGDANAEQSTPTPSELMVKTPWMDIDDVFYEARGTTWALSLFLRAVEVDFAEILKKKNAVVSLRQIVRELEATQATVWSPVVLNGYGFGFVTNYSLIMASYISRANAAIIDLRDLLARG